MFLVIVFHKCSNNFFAFKITNNTCPRHSVFDFFYQKNFFRAVWNIVFCKNVFIFWCSYNITNFKFRIFIINFFSGVNECVWFYINRFHFNCSLIVLLDLLTISYNFSIYTFSDIEVIYLQVLFLNVLINISATTSLFSLCVEYISVAFSSNYGFIDLL